MSGALNTVQSPDAVSQRDETVRSALLKITELKTSLSLTLDELAREFHSLLTIDWEGGYERAIATLERFGFLREGEAPTPDLEAVMRAFAPEKHDAIRMLRSPRLILDPVTTFDEKVRAIDRSGISLLKRPTYVDEDVFGKVNRNVDAHDPVTGFTSSFIDGADNPGFISPDDDPEDLLGKRKQTAALIRTQQSPHLLGTGRHSYISLMMQSLHEGFPIDRSTYTILDADGACSDERLPCGSFDGDQAGFVWRHPVYVNRAARFRSAVRGDVVA